MLVGLDGSMGEEVTGRGESNCLVWLGRLGHAGLVHLDGERQGYAVCD